MGGYPICLHEKQLIHDLFAKQPSRFMKLRNSSADQKNINQYSHASFHVPTYDLSLEN